MAATIVSLLPTAMELQHKMSAWLESHGHTLYPTERRCRDPILTLPPSPPIYNLLVDRGISSGIAKSVAYACLNAVESLAQSTQDQYTSALDGVESTHDFCGASTSVSTSVECRISAGVRDAFVRTYERQVQAIVDEVLAEASSSPTSARNQIPSSVVSDPTPILEYAYVQSPRPTTHEKAILARVTGRTEKQITIWFQNRRARDKTRSVTRERAPKSIDELEVHLRAQRAELRARIAEDGRSGSDPCDSSGQSALPPRNALPTVEELTRLLEDFHIDDGHYVSFARCPPACSRRTSTTSSDNVGQPPVAGRRTTRRPKRKPAQANLLGQIPDSPDALLLATRSTVPPPTPARRPLIPSKGPPLPYPRRSSLLATSDRVSSGVSEAVSSNKAHRARKQAPLPTRRPRHKPIEPSPRELSPHSREPSSSSSSPSTPSTSSRASSLSSGLPATPNDHHVELPPNPGTKELYYKDATTGQYIPVGSSVLMPAGALACGTVAPAVAESNLVSAFALGPPGRPLFAPDHDPRALSSNLLQQDAPSQPAPVDTRTHCDLSESVTDVQAVDSVVMHAGDAALTALPNQMDAFVGDSAKDMWAHNPAHLDIVNYAYDVSWTTNTNSASSWAQLLGVEL